MPAPSCEHPDATQELDRFGPIRGNAWRRDLWPDEIDDELPGSDATARDREVAARAERFLQERDRARPFLLVLFLDASHLPYTFPPETARFTPYTERLYYSEMADGVADPRPVVNRYRNALASVDRTAGDILAAAGRAGVLERAVVVVAGDHGQALLEHGLIGHNTAFDRLQTGTPLLLRIPGVPPSVRSDLTRHVDLVPTLLPLLGVENPPEDYTVGRSLLGGGPSPADAVACNARACAVMDGSDDATVFPLRGPTIAYEVRGPDGRRRPAGTPPAPGLRRARQEIAAFLE